MPRKRRPTPPLPGSIIRNLAPKQDSSRAQTDTSSEQTPALTASSSRQSTAGSDIESSYCGVPQCTTPNCRLPTHINYGQQRKQSLLLNSRTQALSSSSTDASPESSSQLRISPTMDSKPTLPIDDTPNHDFRKLFIYFFNSHFDDMVLVFRPQLRDPAFKHTIYRLALHNSIYCLTLVAQSHMSFIKDGLAMPTSSGDHLTDSIYTQLLKMTREKIQAFNLDDTDVLLMAIVVLCEYDLHLHQYDALSTHHNGMKILVSKRGGIHNLGLSLPYVLRMDRFLAIRSNQLPQFSSSEIETTSVIAHQMEQDFLYGSSFRDESITLSEPIKSVCIDSAYLLELMDELSITFDPKQLSQTVHPKMEYFYFLRENVEVRYTVFNHRIHRSKANILDRLILCASQLVTYYVAEKNFFPLVTDLLATRIWNMLTNPSYDSSRSPTTTPSLERGSSDPSAVPKIDLASWKGNMKTLLWLLFACALPASQSASMTFTGHLSSALPSPDSSRSPPTLTSRASPSSQGQSSRSIQSPSSSRRQLYLPSFILYVAEHLVGERPLSGTKDWDNEVIEILESYIWAEDRVEAEFESILRHVHECVVQRATDEE